MTSSEPSRGGTRHKDQRCGQWQPCATLEQGNSRSRAALTLQQAKDAPPACQELVKSPALLLLGPNLALPAVSSLLLGSGQAACPPVSSSLPGFTGIHLCTSATTAREHHTVGCCAAGPASSTCATASQHACNSISACVNSLSHLPGQEGPQGVTAVVHCILDKLSLPGVLCCSGEAGMEERV